MNDTLIQKQLFAAQQLSQGDLGVSALHLETNRKIDFNAEQRFLMCSTYKVAIATYLLACAQENKIDLNELCDVKKEDFLPGMYSSLNQLNYDVPQKISLHSLMIIMLQESCNTATKIILEKIGKADAIEKFLLKHGLNNIAKDYYSIEEFGVWEGLTDLPKNCSVEEFMKLAAIVPAEKVKHAREEAKAHIEKTQEGTASPQAMTNLLALLFEGKLVEKKFADLIFTTMRRCRTGPNRLMGLLPPRTPVAHKTGSLTGYTCDIGLITLPHKAGHIAISVYIKNSTGTLEVAERVIAEVARTVYDAFLLC